MLSNIVVVIPVYNEAATIGGLVETLVHGGCKVIVDDGGSTDGSQSIARAAGASVLPRPQGVGPLRSIINDVALIDKLATLGTEFIITMDAGGTHDPVSALFMKAACDAGSQALILGTRPLSKEWHGPRTLLSRVAAKLLGVPDATCGLRCYPFWMWQGLSGMLRNRTGFTFHFVVLGLIQRLWPATMILHMHIPYKVVGKTSLNWKAIGYAARAMIMLKLGKVPTC